MSRTQTSLKGVSFIIADSNVYFSSLLFSMLKGFGADKIIQARDAQSATESLQTTKLDVMLCDFMLPANGGMAFVRGVHEGKDLQRLFSTHRRRPPLEELRHLDRDPLVAHIFVVGRYDAVHRHPVAVNARS